MISCLLLGAAQRHVTGMEGEETTLPCDHGQNTQIINQIIWYSTDNNQTVLAKYQRNIYNLWNVTVDIPVHLRDRLKWPYPGGKLMTISRTQLDDEADYVCSVHWDSGSVNVSVKLTVFGKCLNIIVDCV